MSFFPVKKLNEVEKINLQNEFDNLFLSAEGREKLFVELKNSIATMSFEDIYNFSDTYTKWYALVAWKKINSLKFEDFLFTLDKTSFLAILLGRDILMDIINYLNIKALDEKDMQNKYEQIKAVFLNSKEIIFVRDNNTSYTVFDFVLEIKKVNNDKDNLFFSNVISNLSNFIKKRCELLSFDYSNIDEYIAILKSCSEFLIGVQKETIWYMTDAVLYPAQYEEYPQDTQDEQILNNPEFSSVNNALDEIVNLDSESHEDENNLENDEELLVTNNIYIKIKSQLEQQFAYDENGELAPIEEVLSILSQMAEEQGDANIEELYMFDENVGKFVWNEELTNTK